MLDEYVSVEGARRDYGVVLTGETDDESLAVDYAATEALRAKLRADPNMRRRHWQERLNALRRSAEENARRAGEALAP